MKQILLSTALLGGVCGFMTAATVGDIGVRNYGADVKTTSVQNQKSAAQTLKELAPGVSLTVRNGVKHLVAPEKKARTLAPALKGAPQKSTTPEGYVLFESFEDWDGDDYTWTPEGWIVDMKGDVDRNESWTPGAAAPMMPSPSDGKYYYGIQYSTGDQDEWLISPYVTVEEGMNLSYWLYLSPIFLFNLDNVDWDTFEFVGDPEVSATLQIWAQEEGGEWVMLRDYFDEYKEYTLDELFMMDPEGLEKNEVSLANYYGKKTRVAFRYVGTDGNTMFIDAIGIGYPSLGDVRYISPFETLYWGFERTPDLTGLTAGIAQYPVYAPLTWQNVTSADATYTWTYCDPATGNFVTSDNAEELTVTYVPDYRSAASKKNNLFYPPTLSAEAEHATPGEYTAPYVYFQAGGKAEYSLQSGEEFDASLMQFDYHDLGLAITTVSDDELGALAIPVFGHDPQTNQYWLNYSLNGEEAEEGDYNRTIGIANLYIPSAEKPLVINGVTVFGYGKISDNATLKATVYGLNSEMSSDFSTFELIASANVSGTDILRKDANDKSYLCIPFDFATPAVIQSTDEHPAYMIMLEGFNSDAVEYFAPLQSQYEDPYLSGMAYMMSEIDLSNHTGRPAYINIKKVVYKENGEYYDPEITFAFGLDAEYPWLTTDCEEIALTDAAPEATVALGSYYDGSKLTVTAPAGLTATVSGRYNDCQLKVSCIEGTVDTEGTVVVEGPGVKVTIPVSCKVSGITQIAADSNDVVAIYDITGASVSKKDVGTGVYIVRYADGTVKKVMVK